MAIRINEPDEFVEELAVDYHLDLFAFFEVGGLDVGLYVA